MSKEYSPFFKYRLRPATENDPISQCIKIPDDHTKCEFKRTSNRLAYEAPFNMKLYHNNKPISYSEGHGFPRAKDNTGTYYPVEQLEKEPTPLHILDNGNLQCSKPIFKEGIMNNYNSCEKMKVPCCQPTSTCTFNKCIQPDHRFGMAESVYKQFPEHYKDFQHHNRWKNFSSPEFIQKGDYRYITKQQWLSAPWSLERYAVPKECPEDHYEEWRTDADRCHSEYKICHNLFNNMTRRKCIL